MGKQSVIKLLITNSRGKNGQERAYGAAAVSRRLSHTRVRKGVNKVYTEYTPRENCRALRVATLFASRVPPELRIAGETGFC